ncbi:MAG: NAD(P)-dependent oxidoreductase [Haloarculaceae archaeon]
MAFQVFVEEDVRIEEMDYCMGLEPLLEASDVEVTFLPPREGDEIGADELAGAEAFVSARDLLTADSLARADDLRIVTRGGAGFDNLDLDALTERGVVACHAPQGPTQSVAEATVMMLTACAHNTRRADRTVRERGFEGRMENMGSELQASTVGIVGLGLIGSRVVELLAPYDPEIIAHDPYVPASRAEELGVELVDRETVLARSDLLSLHVPLTEETHHMLGRDDFRAMKGSASLVNTTRGGIYPDEELAAALRAGELDSAAIDVFEGEPDVEGNPLLKLEDCLMTPHSAGINREGMERIGHLMSESILNVKDGELPINILNPEVYDEPVPEENLTPSFRPEEATRRSSPPDA